MEKVEIAQIRVNCEEFKSLFNYTCRPRKRAHKPSRNKSKLCRGLDARQRRRLNENKPYFTRRYIVTLNKTSELINRKLARLIRPRRIKHRVASRHLSEIVNHHVYFLSIFVSGARSRAPGHLPVVYGGRFESLGKSFSKHDKPSEH
jgi:hypothetical protein